MKPCPSCSILHAKPGTFCSRSCANRARVVSDESRLKRSLANKAYWASLEGDTLEAMKTNASKAFSMAQKAAQAARKAIYDAKPFEELGWGLQRKRVLEEQAGRCAGCGLAEWRDVPLVLEVDHKDGDSGNNVRDNLEALCPNCHSITPTWRGRNINTGRRKVSDEELIKALQDQNRNIRQALLQVGMAAKGANYGRAKALLTLMDQLP